MSTTTTTDLLDIHGAAAVLGVSARQARRLLAQPDAPEHYAYGERCRRWDAAELEAWRESRRQKPGLAPADASFLGERRARGPRKAAA